MRIKRVLMGLIIGLLLFVGCQSSKKKEEVRATWISYIDYTEILWGKSEEEFKTNVKELIENCQKMKINTLYVHASAFSDAYFDSKIYPSAKYITGTIGDTLSFDPFNILVEEAKKEEMNVEAWINPYRSFTVEEIKSLPVTSIQREWVKNGSRALLEFNGRYYLNPADSEAKEAILGIVKELIENYKIDGIHMDDYFYPEGIDDSFDSFEFLKSEYSSVSDFRKEQVNQLVKEISKITKKANLDFSISPAGNIEYSTESIYGDIKKWVDEEWVDTLIPQIYFGYQNEALPYLKALGEWESIVKGKNVDLVIGLAAYKINQSDPYAKGGESEWITESNILKRQIKDARKMGNYKGYSLYSYHSIFYPESEDAIKVSQEIEEVIELNQ